MACFYLPNTVIGIFKILGIYLLFVIITTLVTIVFSKSLIVNNWEKYRCNPLVIMFAEYFDHTPEEALADCMFISVKKNSVSLLSPLITNLNANSYNIDSLKGIMNQMNGFVGNVGSMFSDVFNGFLDQLGNVTSAIQYLMIKFQVLLQRLGAALLVMVYAMYSILQGLQAVRRDPDIIAAFKFFEKMIKKA